MSDQPVVGKIEFAPFGNLTPEARPGDWKIVAEGQNKRIKALEAERDALKLGASEAGRDRERIEWLQTARATIYRSETCPHWVVVDERQPSRRTGVLGTTLRDAIDNAMAAK